MKDLGGLSACLHSGCTVHFHPSLSPRPSFRFSEGETNEMVEQNYDLNLKYDLYTFVFIYIYLCEGGEVTNYL